MKFIYLEYNKNNLVDLHCLTVLYINIKIYIELAPS